MEIVNSKVTLGQFIDLIDECRKSPDQKIQLVRYVGDWDSYDEVMAGSDLLAQMRDARVIEIEGIDKGVIRVNIDWSDVMTYDKLAKTNDGGDSNDT